MHKQSSTSTKYFWIILAASEIDVWFGKGLRKLVGGKMSHISPNDAIYGFLYYALNFRRRRKMSSSQCVPLRIQSISKTFGPHVYTHNTLIWGTNSSQYWILKQGAADRTKNSIVCSARWLSMFWVKVITVPFSKLPFMTCWNCK